MHDLIIEHIHLFKLILKDLKHEGVVLSIGVKCKHKLEKYG